MLARNSRETNGRPPPPESSPAARSQCCKTLPPRHEHHSGCNVFFSFLSLGRTPPRSLNRKRNSPQRHSLQDASYHNRIVKERHKPTPQRPHHHQDRQRASTPATLDGNVVALTEPARDFCHGQRFNSQPSGDTSPEEKRTKPQPTATATSPRKGTGIRAERHRPRDG